MVTELYVSLSLSVCVYVCVCVCVFVCICVFEGESNCGDSKYGCSQMAMVREWRNQWGAANTGETLI